MKYPKQTAMRHTWIAALYAISSTCNAGTKPARPPSVQATAPAQAVQIPTTPAVKSSSDTSGLVNIAKGKPARQSSDSRYGGVASRAVDGNVDGNFTNLSVTHTSGDRPNEWLEVDLEKRENIDHVVVWNRTDCCAERLSDYWIFVSDKPFAEGDIPDKLKNKRNIKALKGDSANPSFMTKAKVGRGRYVRIQLDGSEHRILSLAEVEVYQAR